MARKPTHAPSRGYSYETARNLLATALNDLRILSGDVVGPSGASWQDVAGTCAVNLRVLAGMLDSARAGRVIDGPAVFPSPDDLDDAYVEDGTSGTDVVVSSTHRIYRVRWQRNGYCYVTSMVNGALIGCYTDLRSGAAWAWADDAALPEDVREYAMSIRPAGES